ncbi:MAG: TolC family protein, partial [Candidatus Aminicenantales bacterium]
MRRTSGWLILVMLAALGPAFLAAQEPPPAIVLTLDEAVAMALRQNPFFLATQEREMQAKSQVRSAVSRFLPSLEAQGTNTLDEKLFVLEFPSLVPGQPPQRISIDFTKNYQTALSFSLPLFAGGRLV